MPNEGDTAVNKRTGQRAVFQGGQWHAQGGGAAPKQEASMRSRMDLGLAPMVSAHEGMGAVERQGNPYSLTENPGNAAAKAVSSVGLSVPALGIDAHPFDGFAKFLGGPDYQQYEQSAKAFESQLMPIMSGAAVSPNEAARQIKAALPELGDSPEILQRKGQVRAMMLNGAAKARGLALPYPDQPTWGVNSDHVNPPKVRRYNPQTGRIE